MSDPMQKFTDFGKSPGGLRHFAKWVERSSEVRCGYAIHVLESAANEMELLNAKIEHLSSEIEKAKQIQLF